MKKVKAFTLMELLIGMIVSAIVISFCYMSYGMIHKQYMEYRIVKKEVRDAMEFSSVLNNDMAVAEKIQFSENKLILVGESDALLEYSFMDSVILRKDQEALDTFQLKGTNIVPVYLNGQENSSSPLLLSLSFDALVLGEEEHFWFSKVYDAQTMINTEIQNLQNN